MQIVFKTADDRDFSSVDFQRWIETEGVGFETDFDSCASFSEAGSEKRPRLVWTTSWSGFVYKWIVNKKWWVYDGAEKGFLAQDLLPPVLAEAKDVEIVRVFGTYGNFEGPDALESYQSAKRWWEEITGVFYDSFETFGFFHHGGWKKSEWTKLVYELVQNPEMQFENLDEAEVARLEKAEAITWAYRRLCDRTSGGHSIGAGRMSLRQFAELIVYMRSIHQDHWPNTPVTPM